MAGMEASQTMTGGPGAAGLGRQLTQTERNWLTTVLIVAGSLVVFGALYALEMQQGRWNPRLRLVYMPSETIMRLFGVSHVLIATLYLATSRQIRSWSRSLAVGALLAVGVGICFGYAGLQGMSPRIASAGFFLYFIVHDFRDQVYFYFEHGDAPAEGNQAVLTRLLFWTPLCLVLSLLVLAVVVTLLGAPGTRASQASLASLPPVVAGLLGFLLLFGFAGSLIHLRRLWKQSGEVSVRRHLRAHRAIYRVLGGSLLLVLIGWVTTGRSHVIVILHVTAWYVFILRQLRLRAADPAVSRPGRFTWQWLRTTPAGFNLLHLGSFAILFLAAGIWVYAFRSDPSLTPLWATLDVDNFRYWTLIHVTLSLRPR